MKYKSTDYNLDFEVTNKHNDQYFKHEINRLTGHTNDFTRPLILSSDLAIALSNVESLPLNLNESYTLRKGGSGTLTF
jgi:hypothetical protein